jgi:hypothetical protein
MRSMKGRVLEIGQYLARRKEEEVQVRGREFVLASATQPEEEWRQVVFAGTAVGQVKAKEWNIQK